MQPGSHQIQSSNNTRSSARDRALGQSFNLIYNTVLIYVFFWKHRHRFLPFFRSVGLTSKLSCSFCSCLSTPPVRTCSVLLFSFGRTDPWTGMNAPAALTIILLKDLWQTNRIPSYKSSKWLSDISCCPQLHNLK